MDYMEQNEELYRAWIGTKKQDKYYAKMRYGGFSFLAFFPILAELLYLTRKMYLELIIISFIRWGISLITYFIFQNDVALNIATLAMSIISGFIYYPLYKWNIKRKIEKNKRKGLNYEEQLNIAKKCGGDKITVSVVAMFLILIIINLIIYICTFTIVKNIIRQIRTADLYYNVELKDEYKENTIPSISNEIYNNLYEDDYQNTSNKDIWILDYCSVYYDSNKWEETTIMGNPALQYKDTGASYLGYVGGYLLEEEINIKSIDIEKDFLEKMVERLLENEGFTVSNGEWKEINDDLIVLKAVAEKDNTKMPYYFYITNNSINGFLIIDLSENTPLAMEEAEKVMNTLK